MTISQSISRSGVSNQTAPVLSDDLVAQLLAKIESLEKKVESLEKKVESLEKENEGLKKEVKKSKKKIKKLRESRDSLRLQLNNVQKCNTSNIGKLNKVNANMQHERGKIATLKESLGKK
ncbi:hypothetical protein AKO1_011726 [Acrasis kona]|uniref:Uncharacterized protein n=1 Tax=Acrasis kona TaxID=1008807 RepID=A0AAW2Z6H6_9EUKA